MTPMRQTNKQIDNHAAVTPSVRREALANSSWQSSKGERCKYSSDWKMCPISLCTRTKEAGYRGNEYISPLPWGHLKRCKAFTHVSGLRTHQSKGRHGIQALNLDNQSTKVWVEASCHLKLGYIANTNDGIQSVINLVPGRRRLPSALVEGGQAKPCLG